jgi:hypothetical protein
MILFNILLTICISILYTNRYLLKYHIPICPIGFDGNIPHPSNKRSFLCVEVVI